MAKLSLDLGVNTGYAILEDNGKIKSGTKTFLFDSSLDRYGKKWVMFDEWLHKINDKRIIDRICFEDVNAACHRSHFASKTYFGLSSTLEKFCEIMGIPYEGIPVTKIKKHIAGHGNATKKEVIEAVRKRGFLPKDDNEADALAILFCHLETSIPDSSDEGDDL